MKCTKKGLNYSSKSGCGRNAIKPITYSSKETLESEMEQLQKDLAEEQKRKAEIEKKHEEIERKV